MRIVQQLQRKLATEHAEPAHLKTIAIAGGRHAVANLVSSDTPACLSLASRCHSREAHVIINARVAIDPQRLQQHVQTAVQEVCRSLEASPEFLRTQRFRPGRPNPTHRYVFGVRS